MAIGNNLPINDHQSAGSAPGEVGVVRSHDEGGLLFGAQRAEKVNDVRPGVRIQISGRLIGQNNARVVDECSCVQTPRPMTHDLLKSVIEELGGRLERIVVSELKDNTFYATLRLRSQRGALTLDARPSDAIALALRSGARIFVEEAVIQSARSMEDLSRENEGDVGRLQKWLENLSDDDLGKYKM